LEQPSLHLFMVRSGSPRGQRIPPGAVLAALLPKRTKRWGRPERLYPFFHGTEAANRFPGSGLR
jgi:hypothetical protein